MLTKIVHNAVNSNKTILLFILLFDEYDLRYNNKIIIKIHLTVEIIYINEMFISVRISGHDPL